MLEVKHVGDMMEKRGVRSRVWDVVADNRCYWLDWAVRLDWEGTRMFEVEMRGRLENK